MPNPFKNYLTRSGAAALSTGLLLCSISVIAEDYRLWLGSRSESRQKYELELTRLVLDSTRAEFGDYSIQPDYRNLSPQRRGRQSESKNLIDIVIQPYHIKRSKNLQYIPLPVMKGLLGLRQIITTHAKLDELTGLETVDQLRQYKIGQGLAWMEITLYEHNGFSVVEAPYGNLFAMLARGRFDILPLGATEIDNELNAHLTKNPDLSIVPELFIYYPHPVFFYVDRHHPDSISRITKGIKKIQGDGSFDRLIQIYFGDLIKHIQQPGKKAFILKNPILSPELDAVVELSLIQHLFSDTLLSKP